jgi:hypothetical protein
MLSVPAQITITCDWAFVVIPKNAARNIMYETILFIVPDFNNTYQYFQVM